MKRIAWGVSKLLWLYLDNNTGVDFDFIVDSYSSVDTYHGITVKKPDFINALHDKDVSIYIFAVSNTALYEIIKTLSGMGFVFGENVFLYSELFKDSFAARAKEVLGRSVDATVLPWVVASTLNSRKSVHTTICGNWLFLEALKAVADVPGDVAEVGCYEGGNALVSLQSKEWDGSRRYVLMDSFDGFPDVTRHDPKDVTAGTYRSEKTFGEIISIFKTMNSVDVVKGFVPASFAQLSSDRKYAVVFYDCDLYQPALDTFAYFWDKIPRGGILLIHDYFCEPGGFHGVRKAVHEFFDPLGVTVHGFWHNTMALIRKD